MVVIRDDIVAWLELGREEESGTTYDEHGDNDGTLNGGVGLSIDTPLAKGIGSFDFDGTDDYLSTTVENLGDTWTINVWFKADTIDANRKTLLGFKANNTIAVEFDTDFTANTLVTVGGSTVTQNLTTPTGSWVMLTLVKKGTGTDDFEVYYDASLDSTHTPSAHSVGGANDEIGASGGGSNTFDGHVGQVIVSNRAWTSTEISSLYNSGDGVTYRSFFDLEENNIRWWAMDGDGVDETGNGGATVSGPTTAGTQVIGTALDFNGSTDSFDEPDAADISGNSVMTIAGWINPDSVTTNQAIFHKSSEDSNADTTGAEYRLLLLSDGDFQYSIGNGSGWTQNTVPSGMSTGNWYHIAMVSDGSTLYLYKNGVLLDSVSGTINPPDTDGALYFGKRVRASTDLFLDAQLDEWSFYDRALPSGEIRRLYGFGAGLRYEDLNNESFIIDRVWAAYELNGDFTDAKNNTYDLTSSGGPTSNGSGGPTNLPEYYSFDGTDDVASSTDLVPTRDFSIGYWLNTTTTDNTTNTMTTSTVDANEYFQSGTRGGVDGKEQVRDRNDANTDFALTTTVVNDGNWYNIGGVYDSGGKEAWVNATLEGTDGVVNTPSNLNKFLLAAFERDAGITSYSDISLAQVIVFKGTVTLTEWNELYNAGAGNAFPFFEAAAPEEVISRNRAIFFSGGV